MNTKTIVLLPVLSVIVFVLEQALLFLPNIQLTIFLIILYSKVLGLKKTSVIIIIYLFLDNLFMSSFSIIFTPFMFLGYIIIPLTLNTVFKSADNILILACLSVLYSFLYCLVYVIPNTFIYHIHPLVYLSSDLIFQILLACSSFISVLWLYEPLYKLLKKLTMH